MDLARNHPEIVALLKAAQQPVAVPAPEPVAVDMALADEPVQPFAPLTAAEGTSSGSSSSSSDDDEAAGPPPVPPVPTVPPTRTFSAATAAQDYEDARVAVAASLRGEPPVGRQAFALALSPLARSLSATTQRVVAAAPTDGAAAARLGAMSTARRKRDAGTLGAAQYARVRAAVEAQGFDRARTASAGREAFAKLLSGSSETASDAGGAKGAEEQEAGVWAPAPLWLNPLWQGLSQQEQDEL